MSSTSAPVILIFGSGPNTGLATAKKFASEGYKVAAVSRNPYDELKAVASLIIPADMKDPSQVAVVFEQVTKELGIPHVIVYNAYDMNLVTRANPIQVLPNRLLEIMAVNIVSAHEAARLAIKGFSQLPETAAKTFLFTGNPYHTQLITTNLGLGIGKTGTAYWIEGAAKTPEYLEQGFKFYYVDERTVDGHATNMDIDGPGHAVEFWRLSHEIKEQTHWDWTFVKGTPGGYVKFEGQVERELKPLDLPVEVPEGGIPVDELLKLFRANGIVL